MVFVYAQPTLAFSTIQCSYVVGQLLPFQVSNVVHESLEGP